jgi:hypothetical protein
MTKVALLDYFKPYYIETKNEIETVYLASIYDKSEFSTISKTDLLKLIEDELR